jgi:hypothetical protein
LQTNEVQSPNFVLLVQMKNQCTQFLAVYTENKGVREHQTGLLNWYLTLTDVHNHCKDSHNVYIQIMNAKMKNKRV